MSRVLVLLAFGGFMLGCARPPVAPVSSAPSREVARAPVTRALPAQALASRCRAEPSTVYGDEAVVFEIEGPRSSAAVGLELRDERGQIVLQDRTALPGRWRPNALKSGDFRLAVLRSGVSCWVTVNRELSRATEPAR